jgi:glutamate--cysteine ligase
MVNSPNNISVGFHIASANMQASHVPKTLIQNRDAYTVSDTQQPIINNIHAFDANLLLISQDDTRPLLCRIQRGIEKEGLRTNDQGHLSITPHPAALGSALTNTWLTTDFSESLLEFITPVFESIDETLAYLNDIHALAYQQLHDEIIWGASMPCILPADNDIPLAQYGTSNIATMKTVYRNGLGLRYGRAMQTVAGIHYNFSLPEAFWRRTFEHAKCQGTTQHTHLQHYIDERYFDLIRNFRRNYWLLIYLFGAAPCVDPSFVQGRENTLDVLTNNDLYQPMATSLRMGDLGYQSSAQQSLFVCYNTLENYIETLSSALRTPYAEYETLGVKNNNEYQQLSSSLLQIENEFYSAIRPKRVAQSGETPLKALKERGIEYIEVRCLDINPFLATGIDAETIQFLDAFLLHCLLDDSPQCDQEEFHLISQNQARIVHHGRDPNIPIFCGKNEVPMRDCANKIIDRIEKISHQLDTAHQTKAYTESISVQREKVADSALTPAARMLATMQEKHESHIEFCLRMSQAHAEKHKSHRVEPQQQQNLLTIAEQSIASQQEIEQQDSIDFESFLAHYFEQ